MIAPYRRPWHAVLWVVAFAGLSFAAIHLAGFDADFSVAALQRRLAGHQWEGLAVFVGLFALGNLSQVPGWIFLAAAVVALGPIRGGVATYVAATLSCLLSFVVIRYIGKDALRQFDNGVMRRILRRLDTHPLQAIVLLRTVFQTAPVLNYALALSGARFRDYFVGTLLGLPLPIALYCLFFDFVAKMLRY